MDRIEFFERLRKSHLLSESQWEQMAYRFDGAGSSTNVAESLVAEGILTSFQISNLTSGDAQPLILGRYRLLDELGRGGMGRVYKALHTVMDRVVAIKVISPELIRDPLAVEWFRREVRACTQLAHPNIVMAYDADEAEGLHFLVMEYVHGITLDALVKQIGPLPIPYACAVMCQVARGLQHAHDKEMVHRDIKPGNLLIPFSESEDLPEILVKILDFGLARLQGKTKGDTIALRGETGVLGTPDYIAPEQSRDIHSADIRSDLYSLGCAFYFALAGRVPFPGENAMEKLLKHLTEIAEPLEKIRSDVPPEIAGLVRRLMAKDPADRPQTPAEVAKELDSWEAEPSSLDSATGRPGCPPFLSPPTHHPAAKSNTVIQPAHTSCLDKIEVFAPSRREVEVSDFSCLPAAPANEFADKPKKRETHDTLSISRSEDTEAATAEALLGRRFPGHGDRRETDATQLELPEEPSPDQTSTGPPPIDPEIRRLWQQWTDLVQPLIDRRGPSPLDAELYRNVHTSLLQACRRAIDACAHPERRAFYEECLSIAQPWLKLQSFAVTDPIMLDSLLQRCRQIALELNNGISAWSNFQLYAVILTVLNVLAGAVWYWKSGRLWLPVLLRIFDWNFSQSSLRMTWGFLQTHPSLLVGVVFPLVLVLAVVLWSRSART